MIPVTHEPDDLEYSPPERCCLCRSQTRYWHTPMDVAVCQLCSINKNIEDLPTKQEWCAEESKLTRHEYPYSHYAQRLINGES